MKPYHDNLKEFDKRSNIEAKKVKDMAAAMEKVKKALEVEKKAYCIEFKKGLTGYIENQHLSPQFREIMKSFEKQMEMLEKSYDVAIAHINDVSINALGYLPKKFDVYKKTIKLVDKAPESIHKLKDFEFDRLQYTS